MHVVLTGANRGIGLALADRYRAAGHSVTGTSRDGSGGLALDVTDPDAQRALAGRLGDRPVDLLVCNAGVYLDKGQSLESGYPAKMWADTFAVNVTGVFLSIQNVLPHLRRARTPKIGIISSQMASQTTAPGGSYIYRASKAAALNLGRNLAADLRGQGVAVGIYHPGWVQTDMGGGAAAIPPAEAAAGLMARFAALSMGSTGCFETWDGRAHPL
ncbi:SDR family NAD(P)-dependent oxidoreductase [Sedimentitalea sp. JM2-8]|uniref:SDR family NAD(P)-dependent oxidoreductase n=1 Tax=Sedimentitalea xiamensis TaxID=3050037 RepID=A0ABT7FDV5_9RHOB|nr:SDR family NAD(P)-dependent oxidoreductase [Sedimentitalea xiamensis]MDK3073300.1 SDR family NAD(P)-dependent oxidoreductase [Sedimentitalea xiamensis]